MRFLATLLLIIPASAVLSEEPVGRTLEYRSGDVVCEGYLVDPGGEQKRPGVLVIHDIGGPSEHFRAIARKLARQGYVVLAADVYGKGVRPKNRADKRATGGRFRGDLALFRQRLTDGLKTLIATGRVDPGRVAATGYCFGGQAVLELARMGADLRGVVSFHGSLRATQPAKKGDVKARVLVLHGAIDPNRNATIQDCVELSKELEAASVDYEMVLYANAVHSFTKRGDRYNKKADERSWRAMSTFLADVLR
ncbi:MAG: dienelactone hydrolase family protein [Planctomycetota bacterium]|jgi:dienelactone hydrolase